MTNEQIQALKAQMKRKHHNWSASVMRTCDYCGHHKDTVTEDDGSAICASCCDAEHATNLANVTETLLASREADKARIAELTQQLQQEQDYALSSDLDRMEMHKTLEARTLTVKLPPLNDDLNSILGRPNFTCCHLAELLRKTGEDIPRKAEREQAAVIYWFLGIYLEHGDKWEDVAKADIQARAAGITLKVGGE